MKRIALLAVIGAGLMALPSTAAAQSGATECPGGVEVSANRICVNVAPAGNIGGELVIGDSNGCSYINGWSANPGASKGYGGLCEGAGPSSPCPGSHPSGPNTGGCFVLRDASGGDVFAFPSNPVTDMFICGNTTGEDPQNSNRRGCSIP